MTRVRGMLMALLAASAGCSGPVGPAGITPYDSSLAKATLVSALDAWKKGEARKLAKGKCTIRFVDDDLVSGMRLADYELEEPDATITLHKDVPVILLLRDVCGKSIRREARYQVAVGPGLAVLRSDR